MKNKYAYLNLATGKFSNSWDEDTHKILFDNEELKELFDAGYRIIKFECLNDEDFEFTRHMKLR